MSRATVQSSTPQWETSFVKCPSLRPPLKQLPLETLAASASSRSKTAMISSNVSRENDVALCSWDSSIPQYPPSPPPLTVFAVRASFASYRKSCTRASVTRTPVSSSQHCANVLCPSAVPRSPGNSDSPHGTAMPRRAFTIFIAAKSSSASVVWHSFSSAFGAASARSASSLMWSSASVATRSGVPVLST